VLAASKALEGTHLLVEVVDGEVYLHGAVAGQAAKSEVEQLTSSVRGVKRIHNELSVRD
jgi:osmotically-inducible protein OsmY